MNNLQHVLTALVCSLLWLAAPAAFAQDQGQPIPLSALDAIAELPDPQGRFSRVIFALDREGYKIVSVRQTMLNRALIRARNTMHLREVVVSRAAGQILRDVVIENFNDGPGATMVPVDTLLEESDGRIRVLRR